MGAGARPEHHSRSPPDQSGPKAPSVVAEGSSDDPCRMASSGPFFEPGGLTLHGTKGMRQEPDESV